MNDYKKLSREEEAYRDVGQTDISRWGSIVLTIVFLFLISIVPVVQVILELSETNEDGGEVIPRILGVVNLAPDMSNSSDILGFLPKKKDIADFESTIENNSFLLKNLLPWMQTLFCRIGLGNAKAYIGHEGWLFYAPDLEHVAGKNFLGREFMTLRKKKTPEENSDFEPDPRKAILQFKEELQKRGIKLILLPVPVKPSVYPEKLAGSFRDNSKIIHNPGFAPWKEEMEKSGVDVFPVDRVFTQFKKIQGEKLFLKTDTHWTPEAMEQVALGLADYLVTNKYLQPGEFSFDKQQRRISSHGDIQKMLKLPEGETSYPQEEVLVNIYSPRGNIAGIVSSEVLLLGDSFANIYSDPEMGWGEKGGFAEALSFYLKQPVDTIIRNDNGSFVTRQQLNNDLKRGKDLLAGKKVVIWQFASRELSKGDWKLFDYQLNKNATRETARLSGQVSVSGTIEEISSPPAPGSTAYLNSIIAIHLKDVKIDGKSAEPQELILFTFGLRDNKLQEAASWWRGKKLEIEAVAWEMVEKKYGRIQRVELDNPDTIALDIFWVLGKGEVDKGEFQTGNESLDHAEVNEQEIKQVTKEKPVENELSDSERQVTDVSALLKLIVEGLSNSEKMVHQGEDGWLFFSQEMVHLLKGKFWGKDSEATGVASNIKARDPLPAILDFNNQLQAAGIELIMAVVPAKAAVYPDKIAPDLAGSRKESSGKLLQEYRKFISLMEAEGVKCLDLSAIFLGMRETGQRPYLKEDSHWSPQAIEAVAQALASEITKLPFAAGVEKKSFNKVVEKIKITGDLRSFLDDRAGTEEVEISRILEGQSPVTPDRSSPVLIIGDSHTLVFSDGGKLHATSAGLAEQLSYHLGFAVDLVGIRGSGATPARAALARRRDDLKGKKVVIWCFTAREFTEATSGWHKVPVIRNK